MSFWAQMPKSATSPIIDDTLTVSPITSRPRIAPASLVGTLMRTRNDCQTEPNEEKRTTKAAAEGHVVPGGQLHRGRDPPLRLLRETPDVPAHHVTRRPSRRRSAASSPASSRPASSTTTKTAPQLSRILKRLRCHGLIKKVARNDKYHLTSPGRTVASLALQLRAFLATPFLAQLAPAES
jgi:hypothetical protein